MKNETDSMVDDFIDLEIQRAQKEHPHFADTFEQAYVILGEEVGEVAMAIYEKKPNEMVSELAQVVAVCRRFIGMALDEKDGCSHKPETCGFFEDGICGLDEKKCAECKKETWFEFMDRAKKNGLSPTAQEYLDKEQR